MELQRDHRRFTRLIAVLEKELARARCGVMVDWKLLADSFEYFEAYPDLVHHPREDILYGYCRSACGVAVPALEGLEVEHEHIAEITSVLRRQLEGVLAGGMVNRDMLMRQVGEYLTMQKAHMRREESKVFPLLLELFDDEDWLMLAEAAAGAVDPLFDDGARRAYDALYQHIVKREEVSR